MATQDELSARVRHIFGSQWDDKTKAYTVPDPQTLLLGSNHGVRLDATVLYADLEGSTSLVDSGSDWFAAEIYKAYLHCAATVIRDNDGVITAYDGDRVMGIFVGSAKNDNAARAALKIGGAVHHVINPLHREAYPNHAYNVGHTIGIDTSEILATRIGVRNDNDIVWVGTSANHAAKLGAENLIDPIRLSVDVYRNLALSSTHYAGQSMWTMRWSTSKNGYVYTSNWNCGTDYKF